MKKLVLSLAVALNLAASGIPVYDGAAFGQRQTEFFEQVKTWLEEADRWVRTNRRLRKGTRHKNGHQGRRSLCR